VIISFAPPIDASGHPRRLDRLHGVTYVELCVTDSAAALDYFARAFAFTAVARAEHPDWYSVLLTSGSARLIETERARQALLPVLPPSLDTATWPS
jgi:hypothetical protein